MLRYYIQVEAVNLNLAVYDTHDISTIRGGSFILLDAMRQLADHFADRLKKITTAASLGLFEAQGPPDLQEIEPEILGFLHKVTGGHATFLVAVEPEIPGDFSGVLERLQAQIRRKQWRMSTVSIPAYAETDGECFVDGWRPGTEHYQVDEKSAKISVATKFRRDYGRKLKHELMSRVLQDKTYDDDLSAKDLGDLASHKGMGVLDGKIAYIHVDGNSFGQIRRALCTTPEARRAFDEQIQGGCREPFLRELLAHIDNDNDFLTRDRHGRQARRLEVLLWGGDEMTIIAPAWRGWQVLDLYYQQARNLTFQGVELGQRAAIVFCHHNTPILQIRRIANDLLDQAKEDIKKEFEVVVNSSAEFAPMSQEERDKIIAQRSSHRYGNATHYLALESFDMLRGSLASFLKEYYKNAAYKKLLIYAEEMAVTLDRLKLIQAQVPRGKVLKVIEALQQGNHEQIEPLQKEMLATVAPPKVAQVRAALDSVVAADRDHWYWIADLWDYTPKWRA